MKKSYIKITVLICALVTAVMVLVGALFAYVQISKINSEYLNHIQKSRSLTLHAFSGDQQRVEDVLLSYNSMKFFESTAKEDIGYYGKTEWKWKTADYIHTLESTDFAHANVILSTVEGQKVTIGLEPSTDGRGNTVVSVASGEDDVVYLGSSLVITTADVAGDVADRNDVDLIPADLPQEVSVLDNEAKAKYEELKAIGFSSPDYKSTQVGWFTTYTSYDAYDSLKDGKIDVNENDVYIFHPFAIVFAKYTYAFYLFPLVLIILIALTIFVMRRMYLNRMSYEARTKNLTRSFAHELKTPLAVTKTYVENWDIIDEKERPEVAARINSEVDHMTKMVNTLLNLSKMDSGDVKLNLEEVGLYDLTQVCINHQEELAKEKKISIEFTRDKEDGEYAVSADLDMIRMVISNFLSNAIKYGKEKVNISLVNGGNNVTFRITNDGEPISAKDRKKIWDLFYKKDESGSDRLTSNGVGLAVNKSILELHKAKFGVESNESGNTFWFEMKKAKE